MISKKSYYLKLVREKPSSQTDNEHLGIKFLWKVSPLPVATCSEFLWRFHSVIFLCLNTVFLQLHFHSALTAADFFDNSLWHVHAYFWLHINPPPSFLPPPPPFLSWRITLTVVVCNEGLAQALSFADCLWVGASGAYKERVGTGGWVDKRQNTILEFLKNLFPDTVGTVLLKRLSTQVLKSYSFPWTFPYFVALQPQTLVYLFGFYAK